MTDFESALDDCLKRIASGQESVNDCLARYPQFAEDLRPLLAAALQVGRIAEVQPSEEFKAGARRQLDSHMRAHPRQRSSPSLFALPAFRVAAIATALLAVLFLGGTAYAQQALPGDALFGWKLASETLARAFSPIRVDMWLAQRRANELLAVRNDPARLAIAWAEYRRVMDRLLAYNDPRYEDEILLLLHEQWATFAHFGVPLPSGTSALPVLPTLTPVPLPTGALPTLTLPSALSTPTPDGNIIPNPTATDIGLPTLPIPPSLNTNTPQPTNTPLSILTLTPPCVPPLCP